MTLWSLSFHFIAFLFYDFIVTQTIMVPDNSYYCIEPFPSAPILPSLDIAYCFDSLFSMQIVILLGVKQYCNKILQIVPIDCCFLSPCIPIGIHDSFHWIMLMVLITGISSQMRIKLRDWAVWQARAGCYSQAALS